VRVVTLAGFFEERHQCPGVVKIDVEGYELRVLRGSARLVGGRRPPVLACALHPWHLQQLGEDEEQFFKEAEELALDVLSLQGNRVTPGGVLREVVLRRRSTAAQEARRFATRSRAPSAVRRLTAATTLSHSDD
jgi:hypothetical protein